MNNFGVIELASTKTTNAPGWAYVPDVAPSPAASASTVVPGNRKRAARNQPVASGADLSARYDAKIRKEIEVLDRDNARDLNIVVPGKGNRLTSAKHTPNVRKILQSAKTFANHLDDFAHALENNPQVVFFPLPPLLSGAAAASHSKNKKRPLSKNKKEAVKTRAKGKEKEKEDKGQDGEGDGEGDITMTDAAAPVPPPVPKIPLLSPLAAELIPPPHPSDGDPLLMSCIPPPPTAEEIKALVEARPLTYMEARARWPEDEQGGGRGAFESGMLSGRALEASRRRQFCEVCGYWGKVRCSRCGSRVCALDCLETHREECVTRYGL